MTAQYDDIVLKRLTKKEAKYLAETVNYDPSLIVDVNFNDTNWKKQLAQTYEYKESFLRPVTVKENLFLIDGPRIPTDPQAHSIYLKDTLSDKSWPDHFLKCHIQGQPSSLEKYVELQRQVLEIQKKEILDLITIFYQESLTEDPIKKAKSDSAIKLATAELNDYIKTKQNKNLNYPNPLTLLLQVKDSTISVLNYENYVEAISEKLNKDLTNK